MTDNFALYSQSYRELPDAQMEALAGDAVFETGRTEEGERVFSYRWPDLEIHCYERNGDLGEHLQGFCGFVAQCLGGEPDARGQLLMQRILATQLTVGVAIEPGRDEAGRAEGILGAISGGLDPIVFYEMALYDAGARLLLAPDGSFDPEADVGGPLTVEPPQERAAPSPEQQARYDRALGALTSRQVPTLSYPLLVAEEAEARQRSAEALRARTGALWSVVMLAGGRELIPALRLRDELGVAEALSPEERAFLDAGGADEAQAQRMLWRLEALWLLAWAAGWLDELPWPAAMCDVPTLLQTLESRRPQLAIEQPRPRSELLDAQQQTLLIHWALRQAWLDKQPVPADLDWSGQAERQPVAELPGTGVIEQRHRAINWLLSGDDGAGWDDVDTAT